MSPSGSAGARQVQYSTCTDTQYEYVPGTVPVYGRQYRYRTWYLYVYDRKIQDVGSPYVAHK